MTVSLTTSATAEGKVPSWKKYKKTEIILFFSIWVANQWDCFSQFESIIGHCCLSHTKIIFDVIWHTCLDTLAFRYCYAVLSLDCLQHFTTFQQRTFTNLVLVRFACIDAWQDGNLQVCLFKLKVKIRLVICFSIKPREGNTWFSIKVVNSGFAKHQNTISKFILQFIEKKQKQIGLLWSGYYC